MKITYVTTVFIQKHRPHFLKHSGYCLSKHCYYALNTNDASCKRNTTKSSYTADWSVLFWGQIYCANSTQTTECGTEKSWGLLWALSLPKVQLQQLFIGNSDISVPHFHTCRIGIMTFFFSNKAFYDQQVKTCYFVQSVFLHAISFVLSMHEGCKRKIFQHHSAKIVLLCYSLLLLQHILQADSSTAVVKQTGMVPTSAQKKVA